MLVLDIKLLRYNKEDISPDAQRLVLAGTRTVLENDKMLHEYGIQRDSVIDLIMTRAAAF
jgi:hypothetical protein